MVMIEILIQPSFQRLRGCYAVSETKLNTGAGVGEKFKVLFIVKTFLKHPQFLLIHPSLEPLGHVQLPLFPLAQTPGNKGASHAPIPC
jgi:hypothetical protein